MKNQRETRFKSGMTSRHSIMYIPIWRDWEALSRAQERQSSVRRRDEAVYIADAGELWTYASHRLCDRLWNPRRKEKERKIHTTSPSTTYLYKGTGNPWAGHSNVTEPSFVVRKLLESSIVGNLGLTLPIGSDHIVYNWRLACPRRTVIPKDSRSLVVAMLWFLPVQGNGEPLCRAHQGKGVSDESPETAHVVRRRNFWAHAAHWF